MGGRSLRILLVDDDPGIRDTIGYFLEQWGHRVHEARDGREALAYLATDEAQGLDLVITDQRMPGAPGEEVVRAAKRRGIKTILMSGDTPALIQQVARAAGADGLLPKPFKPEALEQMIAELLFPEPR